MDRESVLGTCPLSQLCGVLLGYSWAMRILCVEQLPNKMGLKKYRNMDCQPKVVAQSV